MLLLPVQYFGTSTRYGLKILHKCGKRIDIKSQKILGVNFYVCISYRKKNGRGPFCSLSLIGLKDKNEIVFNATKNCYIFKYVFSSLAQNLVSKLIPLFKFFTKFKIASNYDNNAILKHFNLKPLETSAEKMLSILKGLNPSKVASIDNLSGIFLKDGADVLAGLISQLYNLSIKLNHFPRSCKIAKVKPPFKKCSETNPQYYCPFWFLLLLSKTIERIVNDQTEEFLSENKILYMFQSAFGKKYSTNICLGHLADKITTGFGKALFTGMILINLQEVFNTIDHQILFNEICRLFQKRNCVV